MGSRCSEKLFCLFSRAEVLKLSADCVRDAMAAIKAAYEADLGALMAAKDAERERQHAGGR